MHTFYGVNKNTRIIWRKKMRDSPKVPFIVLKIDPKMYKFGTQKVERRKKKSKLAIVPKPLYES